MTFRSRFAFCLVFALSFGAIATASYLQDTGKELPQEEEKLWQYAGQQSSRQTWREGVRAYNYYIKIFPAGKYIEQAYLQMGNLHMRRSRLYSEARKVYEEFCREFPGSRNYWNARFSIAQSWQGEGNNAKAIKELENMVEKAGKAGKTDIRTSAIQRIWRVKNKYFRLYVNQTFTVGQKAVVQANMRGIDKVEYTVSRIPFEEVLERLKAGDRDNLAGALDRVPKDRWEKLKGWTETYDPKKNRWRNESITIPSEKAGIYVVDGTHDKLTMSVTLFVNRFGVITKTAGGKLLVFAQERATSKPIEGMQIQVLHKTNPVSGKTGEDGVFLSDAYKGGTIIGIKDGELVTTSTYYYSYNQNQPLVYIYTDRPIYRPNQQVQFKIVSRTREGSKLNIAPGKKMAVEIRDAKNNVIYKETHSLNEFGSTFGTMTLGDEPALGMYTISLTPEGANSNNYRWGRYGSNVGQFRVDEYRKPEYKVGVTFEKEAVLQGHTVEATVNAMYYFGSPVADAKVEYTILRSRFWSYWRWWDGYYDWYLEENSRFYMPGRRGGERVTTGTGTTDSEGNLVIRFTPEKQEYDAVYTLRAKVTDLSRRSVDGAGTVKATRAEFGMNISLDRWVYKPGDRINAKIRVRTHQGELVPDQKLRVSAYEVEYRKKKNLETKIYEGTTTSDEHGIATIDFTPDLAGGRVRLVVQSQDRFGNAVKADRSIWIYSNRWSSGTWNFNGLDLIPDKKFYEKGDTAKILVTSQFKNVSVLLTLEGADVFFHKIVKIRGNAQLVEIPLDNLDYVPNVFVSVCALKDNAMVRKYKSIVVNPAEKFVNIELVPDKERYEPRETATYTIRTTGSDGKPVSAEVSFGIVDESIYAIQPEIAMDIRKRFVHKRQQSVQTTSSLQYRDWGRGKAQELATKGGEFSLSESDSAPLMGKAPSSRFAGRKDKNAPAYAETVVRSNFADTMYWAASVVTDADGRATITVEIPDNLTTWRATAKAVTKDNRFGQKTGSVITRKDVIVRLELPRFFTQGDRTVITAIAHNYLETAKEMKIVLEVEGFEVEGKKEFVVVVEPEGQKRFDWKTSIAGAGTAKVTVKALTDESSDAMKLEVPILPHGSAKWIARTGFIKGDVSETLTLPEEAIAQASELIVVMSPTHASTVLDALDYLAGYPYGCVEQTMSRFLPTVIAAGTLQKLGIEKPELTKELPLMVSKGLQRLYNFQQGDGGWGWWKNDKSNAHTTAYVLAGLAMAREADFQVSENVLARGISAARRHLGTRGTDPNTKMYLMYALSVAGQKVTGRVGEPESGLSGYGLALQAQILMKNGEEGAAREALGQLVKKVSEGGATAFWEGTGKYGWLGHSVEITAQAMRAIVAIDPEHPLLLKVINWLLQARKGNYWASTKQTAMVVFAMTDYLALTGEMDLDMTLSMDLNGRRIFSEHVTKENWQKFKGIWKFKADEFNRGDNTISFGKTGNGNPVYSIYLKYFANEEFFEASKGGITVERTYYRVAWDGKKRHRVELEEGATVKSGDEIEVTCRIRGDRNYEYLMLEIPMPSGFEAVREQRQRYGWRWNWWYSHKEFRDEKVAVAMTNLHQSNDNVITYTMRAERPGKYSVLPAIVFDMYYPQIGGNSREFRVTVVD